MANETSVMAVIRAYRPTFRNASDKLAFALHSSFLAAGYLLTAAGPPAFSPDACSHASTGSEVGAEGWNDSEDSYAFVYRKDDAGAKKVVLVKCLVIDGELAVDVLDCGAEKEPLHLGIKVNDYVADGEDASSSSYGSMYKNFGSLIKLFNTSLLEKLENKKEVAPSKSTQTEKTPRVDSRSTVLGVPDRSVEEPIPSGIVVPPIPPFVYSDVGPNLGAGMYPSRGLDTGGSMFVGPNDPRWGMSEPFGLPRPIPGVPPGARFDPFGPPDVVTGFEPRRNLQRRPGSHPDLEPFRDPFKPDSDFI